MSSVASVLKPLFLSSSLADWIVVGCVEGGVVVERDGGGEGEVEYRDGDGDRDEDVDDEWWDLKLKICGNERDVRRAEDERRDCGGVLCEGELLRRRMEDIVNELVSVNGILMLYKFVSLDDV